MLLSLSVKNFAIIDNININFKTGMTALTGETGAGKSLIIDAIGLLFGKRASVELIRYKETKATIEGLFTDYNLELDKILEENGIDKCEDLIIKREIYNTNKSVCRVNNSIVNLQTLQLISEYIGDIHTQFDTQGLVNPKNYLSFIDNEEIEDLLKIYKESLTTYRSENKKYLELIKKHDDDKIQEDFMRYQVNELEKAKISVTEEEELKKQFKYLNNFGNIVSSINEFLSYYNDKNSLDNIYSSLGALKKILQYDEKYEEYYKTIEESYYNIDDIVNQITTKFSNFEDITNDLDNVNIRLGIYSDLKRKFKMNTEEIIEYYEKTKETLENIENYDLILKELEKSVNNKFNKTYEIAKNISEIRQEISNDLTKQIVDNLKDLQLKNTKFEIVFNNEKDITNNNFKANGIDNIDFLVSFNKGEPTKSLSKVASGGEMSRFMLALKAIFAKRLSNRTLIFDEIDTGVSGSIAYSIAKKIKSISKCSQVLCVTHLPQVTAICDNHLLITKKIDQDNRTITKIDELDEENRIYEIAKMISNGVVTDASKSLAKELLSTITIN